MMHSPMCVLLSGGMDSVAALHWARSNTDGDIRALLVDYGQPHRDNELFQAARVCDRLGVPRARIAVADALRTGVGITGPITDHDSDPGTNAAFLPCRNLALLSMAVSRACAWWPAELVVRVVIGACKDDAEAFPDCRRIFFDSAEQSLSLGSEHEVRILAPWLSMTKAGILRAYSSNPPAIDDIRRSWSCYRGGSAPCGTCTACVLRARAFAEVGIPDLSEAARMHGGDVFRASE